MVHVADRAHVHVRLGPLEFSLAMMRSLLHAKDHCYRSTSTKIGAHNRNRTGDLFLTKEVLYRLSYVGANLERVMGIEPT